METTNDDVRKNKGKAIVTPDEELHKPYKESLRSPFTTRIVLYAGQKYTLPNTLKLYDGSTDPDDHLIRFARAGQQGEWPMPVWCRMFQQTLDGPAQGWFRCLDPGSIDSWEDLREQFVTRFSLRQRGLRDRTKINRII